MQLKFVTVDDPDQPFGGNPLTGGIGRARTIINRTLPNRDCPTQ
jgi:hypothetical protein